MSSHMQERCLLTMELCFHVLSKDLVRVKATVTEHSRAAKVIVFKKKRRKNYKRKKGMCTTLYYNNMSLSKTL